jgi:hypothetical protein
VRASQLACLSNYSVLLFNSLSYVDYCANQNDCRPVLAHGVYFAHHWDRETTYSHFFNSLRMFLFGITFQVIVVERNEVYIYIVT